MRVRARDQAPDWCGVDVGGEQVRWSRGAPEQGGLPEVLVAPSLVSLGQEPRFVQEALRKRAHEPEWSCHHIVSLTELGAPSLHGELEPQRDALLELLKASRPSSLSAARPLVPLIHERGGRLELMTAQGPRPPSAVYAELLSELLSPPRLLGEGAEPRDHEQMMVWLSAPGESPYRRAMTAHILSEISPRGVRSINRAAAMTVALTEELAQVDEGRGRPVRRWAILDVGATQASLSLVYANIPERSIELSAHRGQSGVGAHALERQLIQRRLALAGQSWSALGRLEKAQLSLDLKERVYWALRHSWPQHLSDPQFARLSPHEAEVSHQYLGELATHISAWLEGLLESQGLLLESLDGLWLSGSVGLALQRLIRRRYPNLRLRFAPEQLALRGLGQLLSLPSARSYTISEPLSEALWLTSAAHPPIQLASLEARAPHWVERLIYASDEPSAIWLSSSASDSVTLWATLPAFSGEPRCLQLAYESPYSAHISWRSSLGEPLTRAEGAWSLALPHHPHSMASAST